MAPRGVTGRSLLYTAILCMLMSVGAWPGVGVGQVGTGPSVEGSGDNLVTIQIKEASLRDVLTMLGQAGDVKIVFGDDIDGIVTANLPEVEIEQALRAVVAQAGHCVQQMPGGIYVVSKEPLPAAEITPVEPPTPEVPGTAGTEPELIVQPGLTEPEADHEGLPDEPMPPLVTPPLARIGPTPRRVLKTEPIPLQFVNAAQVALIFGGSVGRISPTGMFAGQREIGRGIRNRPMAGRSASRSTPGYFGSLSPASMRGDSWAENFRQLGGALGGGGLGGGGIGLGGGGIGQGGRGMGGGGTGGFTALLPEDISAVTAFLDDNSLIVRGTAEAIDEFRETVAMLDKPAKQVEVAVKFISITTTFEEAFGVDWAIKNTRIEVFNQGFAPPQAINSVVRFATGNLDAQLNALVKSSRATVISEPRVATTNNMFASVEFSTEIPFFAANVSYNQFGVRTVDFEPDWIPVENYLDVMPRVNADDSITLMLMPNISNVAGFVEGPNGERIPITTYQNVFTQLTVKDGETAVIGGLITKDDSTTKLRTPLLSQIPIIGKLFDSRAKNLNDTELLIFVTPRILRELTVD